MHFGSWEARGKAYAFTNEQRIFLTELEKKSQITLLKWNAAVVNLQIEKGCQQCQCLKGHPQTSSYLKRIWGELIGVRQLVGDTRIKTLAWKSRKAFAQNPRVISHPCSFLVPFLSPLSFPNKLKVHRGHTPWLLHVTWHATQLHRFQDMFSEIPLIFRISFMLACLGIRQCKIGINSPKQTTAQYLGTPVL